MTPRTHVVLVPGFVGFDALGQIRYYAGVTEVFDEWRKTERARDRNATLHYFDNFPTASVALRARRLREYLLKRVARGEFSTGDRVSLVGHSTGGLDIRKAVSELAQNEDQIAAIDGPRDARHGVRHGDLLDLLKHLVFVSVPHYGTNLGDFGCALADAIQGLLRDASLALQANGEPVEAVRRQVEQCVRAGSSDLLRAVADALNESDESRGSDDEQRATAREARSELALWLEHMSKDFTVIGDLRSASLPHRGSESPAHFSHAERVAEMASWQRHDISTRSYASLVRKRPGLDIARFLWLLRVLKTGLPLLNTGAKLLNDAAERWWLSPGAILARLAPALALPPAAQLLRHQPDLVFRALYTLCADPNAPFAVEATSIAPDIEDLFSGQTVLADTIANDDSDCIVNTRSMLWPFDPDQPLRHPRFLVEADHGDIVGHFDLRPTKPAPNTRHDAYDIFLSGSGFDQTRFTQVWTHIFDSCP